MSHELEVAMLWFGIICGGLTVAFLMWILRSKKRFIAEQSEEISSLERELKNIRSLHCQRNSEASKRIGEVTEKWKIVCKILRRACKRLREYRAENETLRDELKRREGENDALEANLSELATENQSLTNRVVVCEEYNERLSSKFNKLHAKLETIRGAIEHEDGS